MLQKIIDGWNQMSLYRKIRRVFMIGLAIFGLWALTPYLYNRQVNEEFPVAAPAAQAPAAATSAPAAPTQAPAPAAAPTAMVPPTATLPAPATPAATAVPAQPTAMPAATQPAPPASAPKAPTAAPAPQAPAAPTQAPPLAPAEPTAAPAGPVALLTGSFIPGSTPGDRATGSATIYRIEDGRLVLRLQDLDVTNGPDLFVVLSSADNPDQQGTTAGTYLQLDGLKGNQGNQNYELPADIDLAAYKTAVIWCRAFDIVFGYAPLLTP